MKGSAFLTILLCAHLYCGCTCTFSTTGLGSHPDVIHCIGGEVLQQIGVFGWHDGNADVLPEVAVIVVKLIALDGIPRRPFLRWIPLQLDGIGVDSLTLQIGGLLWHCKWHGCEKQRLI